MLYLCSNTLELLRLRHSLIMAVEQTMILEEVYEKQSKLLQREPKCNFKEPFNLSNFVNGGQNYINFIEDGPGSDVDCKLAINEFDR
jgi:hypothetical protein